ncbi:MAG: hypothetical protein U0V74_11335 [Chitinophagales bacterium]
MLTAVYLLYRVANKKFIPRVKQFVLSGKLKHWFNVLCFRAKAIDPSLQLLLLFSAWLTGQIVVYYVAKQKFSYDVFMPLQFWQGRLIVYGFYIQLFTVLITNTRAVKELLSRFWNKQETPYALAGFRIIILFYVFFTLFYAKMHLINRVAPPGVPLQPLPLTSWYAAYLPTDHTTYSIICIVSLGLALMGIAGFLTRYSLLLLAILNIYVFGMPNFFGKMNHTHINVWIPLLLAFSPCADVWSVDAFLKKRKQGEQKAFLSSRYWQSLAGVYLMLGVIYTFSGLRKLWDAGLAWALSDHFVYQIQQEWIEHYFTVPAIRIDHYPLMAEWGGMAIVLFEIAFIFLVFYPWGRWLSFFGGLAFHNIAYYFLYIGFQDLQKVYFSFLTPLLSRKFKAEPVINEPPNNSAYKWVLGGLLSCNSLLAIWGIHSWPFSPYPSYSVLTPGISHMVKIEVVTDKGEMLNMDSIALKNNFRKEDFRPLENEFLRINKSDTVQLKIGALKIWGNWEANLPPISGINKILFYEVDFPTDPDRRTEVVKNELVVVLDKKDLH